MKKEIAGGDGTVLKEFLKKLHPTLKKRMEMFFAAKQDGRIIADPKSILRAGVAGSHGEIRALNNLLYKIDPNGVLGESIFENIIGYNRYLKAGASTIQPPCVNCFYITKGVKYIGFN